MTQPWESAQASELKSIQGICFDIDDTFSTQGKLTSEAYAALWRLKQAGLVLVPITGRPAGWCDLIARFWPVDAVLGENGAFAFFMKEGIRSRLDTVAAGERPKLRRKLAALRKRILKAYPHVRFASDQAYREYDLAIDFREDVSPWSPEEVRRLVEFCKDQGAHAKVSSIHVNTWFGDYDKCGGFDHWMSAGAPGIQKKIPLEDEWLFIGDSPNDEPLFAKFKTTIGVANIGNFLSDLKYAPHYMTSASSGAGFVQMADRLLQILSH